MIKLTLSRLTTIILTAIAFGSACSTFISALSAGITKYIVISGVVALVELLLLHFLVYDTTKNKEEEKED